MVNLQYNIFLSVIKNINSVSSSLSIIKNYTLNNEKNITLEEVNENNINELTFILENNIEKFNKTLKLLDDFENVIIDRFDDFICITYFN